MDTNWSSPTLGVAVEASGAGVAVGSGAGSTAAELAFGRDGGRDPGDVAEEVLVEGATSDSRFGGGGGGGTFGSADSAGAAEALAGGF
jgi:hypothetical protein